MKVRAQRTSGTREEQSGLLRTKVRQTQTFTADITVTGVSQVRNCA